MKTILFQDNARNITVCRVSIEYIVDLRYKILRAGLPKATAQFPGDEEPSTWHVGVFASLGENAPPLSCASFMLNSYQGEAAWQLRGMCTEHQHQRKGLGGKLLSCAETVIVAGSNVRLFWCNAREPAIPFYERHGWTVASDEFDIPTAGPHRKMVKSI